MSGLSSRPKFIVEQIGKLLSAGTPIDEISDILEIDVDEVHEYLDRNAAASQSSTSSRREKYKILMTDMEENLERLQAKLVDSVDNHHLQNAYTKLLATYRDTIDKYEKVSDPNKFVSDLVDEIINPLVLEVAKLIVSSSKDFRMDLGARGLWDPRMEPILKEFVSGLGGKISSLNRSAVVNLNNMLSADYVLDGGSDEIN